MMTTPKQQLQEYEGGKYKDLTIPQFCKVKGVPVKLFYSRASKGWDIERIITQQKGERNHNNKKPAKKSIQMKIRENNKLSIDQVAVPFEETDLTDDFKEWYTQEIKSFAEGVYARFPISLTACMLGYDYQKFLNELLKRKTIKQIIATL